MVLTAAAVGNFADDPHKETTVASQTRDYNNTRTILTYLLKRSPFNKVHEGVVNTSITKTTDRMSNVGRTREVGKEIRFPMTGKAVTEVVFKTKDQVNNMASVSSVETV